MRRMNPDRPLTTCLSCTRCSMRQLQYTCCIACHFGIRVQHTAYKSKYLPADHVLQLSKLDTLAGLAIRYNVAVRPLGGLVWVHQPRSSASAECRRLTVRLRSTGCRHQADKQPAIRLCHVCEGHAAHPYTAATNGVRARCCTARRLRKADACRSRAKRMAACSRSGICRFAGTSTRRGQA